MLRFEYIEHLYALLAAPVLLLFFGLAWRARKRAVRRFGDSRLMERLMPQVSRYRYFLKFGLLLLALVFLVVAWANPQYGAKLAKVKAKSVDIIIAFDISQSMLAEDQPPSRLARARRFTQSLVESLRGERVGLILFAGSAYVQSPVTADFSAILQSIRSANPGMISNQGTALAEAIGLAAESFEENNKNHKALIIITDGEDHEEDALTQAEAARSNGLLLFTVGVGTEEGSFVPVEENGRINYKRDRSGQPVVSHLNESLLREIARAGDGSYFNLSAGSEPVIEALREGIGKMEKRELEMRVFSEYNSYFQWFLGAALLLLIVEFLLPYRSSRSLTGKDIFDV